MMRAPAKLTARRFETAKRDETVLKLRLQGDTERAIAAKLTIAPSAVHKSLERSMMRLHQSHGALAEQLEATHLERLEELYKVARKRALGYGSDAHMWMLRCLQILEKEQKLTGLDQAKALDLAETDTDTESGARSVTTWEAYERRIIPIREDVEREA